MISFKVSTVMNEKSGHQMLPERSTIDAKFSFLGNKVSSTFTAIYNCPVTLPDSLVEQDNRELMDSLRPIVLRQKERMLYEHHDSLKLHSDSITSDTTEIQKSNKMKEILWDVIGDNLVNSTNHRPAVMPLYPEKKSGAYTFIGLSDEVCDSKPFFSSETWNEMFGADTALDLPLYGTGGGANRRDRRTLLSGHLRQHRTVCAGYLWQRTAGRHPWIEREYRIQLPARLCGFLQKHYSQIR